MDRARADDARARVEPQFNWIITFAAAALNIGLNIALIPPYGMTGAAIATVAAYALMFVLTTWNAQRLYPVPYQWRRVLTSIGVARAGALSVKAPTTAFTASASSPAIRTI